MAEQNAGNQDGQNSGANNDNAGTDNGNQNQNQNSGASNGAGAATGAGADAGSEKKFTQSDLNGFLAKEKAKWEKNKDLSEVERVKSENADLKKSLAMREAYDTFETAACAAGAVNPKTLFKAYQSDLEIDESGKITNLKDVLKSAQTESPELFKKADGSADGGAGGDNAKKPTMNDFLRGKVKTIK